MELDTGIGTSLFVLACILIGPIVWFALADLTSWMVRSILGLKKPLD
ncbi:MAG TPA: hypothetical protein VM537_13720 [Anaerolineae bacterium]|nr:hypothetical protein [Anaerolineae bacterium]